LSICPRPPSPYLSPIPRLTCPSPLSPIPVRHPLLTASAWPPLPHRLCLTASASPAPHPPPPLSAPALPCAATAWCVWAGGAWPPAPPTSPRATWWAWCWTPTRARSCSFATVRAQCARLTRWPLAVAAQWARSSEHVTVATDRSVAPVGTPSSLRVGRATLTTLHLSPSALGRAKPTTLHPFPSALGRATPRQPSCTPSSALHNLFGAGVEQGRARGIRGRLYPFISCDSEADQITLLGSYTLLLDRIPRQVCAREQECVYICVRQKALPHLHELSLSVPPCVNLCCWRPPTRARTSAHLISTISFTALLSAL